MIHFFQIKRHTERKLQSVPKVVQVSLLLLLALQISIRLPKPAEHPEDLSNLPSNGVIQVLFLGDRVLAGRLLMLWLQARDTQSGVLVGNLQRDYQRLSQWLIQLNQLDPDSYYPILLAGRIYSQTPSPQRIRIMLVTVNSLFEQSPAQFWRWQAESVLLAKYRLQDKALALQYAQSLAKFTPVDVLPYWARDMQFILLQELYRKKKE